MFNREANLIGFTLESFKLIDLIIIFWTSIIINPKPNSTAESIKKKNVKDSKFRLSYASPMKRVIIYKVIHKISAVNNKCRAVLMFNAILVNIIKKRKKIKLKSPKVIIYIDVYVAVLALKSLRKVVF